jgi:hypothetical protein
LVFSVLCADSVRKVDGSGKRGGLVSL